MTVHSLLVRLYCVFKHDSKTTYGVQLFIVLSSNVRPLELKQMYQTACTLFNPTIRVYM